MTIESDLPATARRAPSSSSSSTVVLSRTRVMPQTCHLHDTQPASSRRTTIRASTDQDEDQPEHDDEGTLLATEPVPTDPVQPSGERTEGPVRLPREPTEPPCVAPYGDFDRHQETARENRYPAHLVVSPLGTQRHSTDSTSARRPRGLRGQPVAGYTHADQAYTEEPPCRPETFATGNSSWKRSRQTRFRSEICSTWRSRRGTGTLDMRNRTVPGTTWRQVAKWTCRQVHVSTR